MKQIAFLGNQNIYSPVIMPMRSLTALLLVIFVLAAVVAPAAAQCGIKTEPGEKADDWNAIFTQNGPGQGLEPAGSAGWTGGDSTYSIRLPNGDSAFFFSDSYIAEYPAKHGDATVHVNERGLRRHEPNCFPPVCSTPETTHYVYNSVVIVSEDRKILTTKVGQIDDRGFSTSYFKPDRPDRLFWVGESVMLPADKNSAGKLWIFLYEWKTVKPGEAFTFEFFGASLAQLNADNLAIERIVPLKNIPDLETHWGIGAWLEKESLYIYGKRVVDGKKKLFVARVDSRLAVERAANGRNWSVWNGKSWTPNITAAVSIIPENDSISDEINVKKFAVNGRTRYLLVTLDTAVAYPFWKDIYLYSACRPEGPFLTKNRVYTTPEAGSNKLPGMTSEQKMANGMVVYNPHLHPQFTENGRLLISYNSNLPFGALPGDSLYVDFYRPRFIRVKVDGLRNVD